MERTAHLVDVPSQWAISGPECVPVLVYGGLSLRRRRTNLFATRKSQQSLLINEQSVLINERGNRSKEVTERDVKTNLCCRLWYYFTNNYLHRDTNGGAFDSAKNHKRQRRKRQSVTAKRVKSQTPKFV